MSPSYYLTAMFDNCFPQRQLGSYSVTRPFLSLRRVWLARLALSMSKDWWPQLITKQCTVKALIKVPLKNSFDPQRRLGWSEKILLTYRGAMFRDAPLNQSATVRPLKSELQRPSYNCLRWRFRMWAKLEVRLAIDCCCSCERSRNYLTTVEELVILKVAQVGCEISLNRKHPSKIIYAANGTCVRVGKVSFGYKGCFH